MNIFLDARMFYHSGIGRYGRNLYRELLKLPPPLQITLGLDEKLLGRLRNEISSSPDCVLFNAPIYSLLEQWRGSHLCRRYQERFDLFHFPHYNIPWLLSPKTVVTCHDLIHFVFPQYSHPAKLFFARRLLKRVANKAKRIITVSEYTKQDFLRFFPQARDKLTVIYNGVGNEFRPLADNQVAEFKRKEGLGDFLLFVGNLKPHKNLPALIAAYARLKDRYSGLKLIILSQKVYNKDISRAISHWKVDDGVVIHQPASLEELILYYNAAQLLVFPSLYEGFGLPPLEAMACGTPVVASKTSSIPEVVGESAIMIDPKDIESITAGIEQGLTDSSLREKLKNTGQVRAQRFTWEKTARQTWQIYRDMVS